MSVLKIAGVLSAVLNTRVDTVQSEAVSHPLVQNYKDNKARYDADYFIEFVRKAAERNPLLGALRETKEYRSFIALCLGEEPFKEILSDLPSIGIDDLEWLQDNMPSGYARARILYEIERRSTRENTRLSFTTFTSV